MHKIKSIVCPNVSEKIYIQFFPQQYFRMMGERCPSCKTKLIFSESMSPCCCNLYCHEKCFVQSYFGLYDIDDHVQPICQVCEEPIEFVLYYEKKLSCKKDGPGIVLYALSGLLFVISSMLIREGFRKSVMFEKLAHVVLGAIVVGYVLSLLISKRKKQLILSKTRCIAKKRQVQQKSILSLESKQKDTLDSTKIFPASKDSQQTFSVDTSTTPTKIKPRTNIKRIFKQ